LYGKKWEDGLLDSGGWGHQCVDTVAAELGKITVDSSTSDSGGYSGRFDLPAATGQRSCEFLHNRHPDPGTDDYYADAVRFPSGYRVSTSQDDALDQFNYQGINASDIFFSAHGSGSGLSVYVVVNSGTCTAGGCPYYSGQPVGGGFACRGIPSDKCGPYYVLAPGKVVFDTWYEIIVHVHWTLGTDGVIEAWYRKKGDTGWSQAFSHSGGFPTLQTGTIFNGTVITAQNIENYSDVDKFGQYEGGDSITTSVYHDNWCRATSFDSAASCFT
jgi:hypothetical protein